MVHLTRWECMPLITQKWCLSHHVSKHPSRQWNKARSTPDPCIVWDLLLPIAQTYDNPVLPSAVACSNVGTLSEGGVSSSSLLRRGSPFLLVWIWIHAATFTSPTQSQSTKGPFSLLSSATTLLMCWSTPQIWAVTIALFVWYQRNQSPVNISPLTRECPIFHLLVEKRVLLGLIVSQERITSPHHGGHCAMIQLLLRCGNNEADKIVDV